MTPTEETVQFMCSLEVKVNMPEIQRVHIKQDAREAMRVVFFCTYKTYLYAQNKISYEYIQILF